MHAAGNLALFLLLPPYVLWPWVAGIAIAPITLFVMRGRLSEAVGWDKLLAISPLFFASPLAAFGAEHLAMPKAISSIVPSWMPWHMFWTYLVGLALIAAALSIASNIQARWSGTLLGIMFFLFVAMMDIPGVAANPHNRFFWALAFRELAFAGGAWAVAGRQTEEFRNPASNLMITVARFVIAGAVVFYAFEHFLHPAALPGVPLEKLTPEWIPGRLVAGYLTGAALAVCGICLLLGTKMRMAATYLGSWIVLMVLLIYLPMVIALPSTADAGVKLEGLNYFFDTTLFAGTVLVLASAIPMRASTMN